MRFIVCVSVSRYCKLIHSIDLHVYKTDTVDFKSSIHLTDKHKKKEHFFMILLQLAINSKFQIPNFSF